MGKKPLFMRNTMLISSSEIIIGFVFLFFVTSSSMFSLKVLWRELPTEPLLKLLLFLQRATSWGAFQDSLCLWEVSPGARWGLIRHSSRDITSSFPELVVWPSHCQYPFTAPTSFQRVWNKNSVPQRGLWCGDTEGFAGVFLPLWDSAAMDLIAQNRSRVCSQRNTYAFLTSKMYSYSMKGSLDTVTCLWFLWQFGSMLYRWRALV